MEKLFKENQMTQSRFGTKNFQNKKKCSLLNIHFLSPKNSSEFTNFSHEEVVNESKDSPSKISSVKRGNVQNSSLKERIIPIRLDSGEEIMPIYTKLEEPEPPAW